MGTRIERVNIITEFEAKGAEKYQKTVSSTGGQVGNLLKKAKAAIPVIAGLFATSAVARLTSSALKVQGAFESVSKSIEIFTGSAKVANRLVQELEDFSVITPFTPEEVVQTTKTLLAFGSAESEVLEITRQLGEVSAASGTSIENLGYIYGQVKAQGFAYAQDLAQFINAGVPIFELLAEQMGVAVSQVKALASEGEVTADIVAKAFEKATGPVGRFTGALEAQSQTIFGLQSTLEGARLALLRAFGERIQEPAKRLLKNTIDLVNQFRDFIAIPVSAKLEEERIQLNLLVDKITDTNIEQEDF